MPAGELLLPGCLRRLAHGLNIRRVVLQEKGWKEMLDLVAYYKENASILRQTFIEMGFKVGLVATNSPSIFKRPSALCDMLLCRCMAARMHPMCGWASLASPAGMSLQRSLTNATLSQPLVVVLVLLAKALCEQAPLDTGETDFAACTGMLLHAHHLALITVLLLQGGHFGGSRAL